VPSSANLSKNTKTIPTVLVGILLDGMPLFNPNQAGINQDPFYPAIGSPPTIDQCISHANPYHYHSMSKCQKAPTYPVGPIESCHAVPACNASVKDYMIDGMKQYSKLTPLGIALDGHIIYGPYDNKGNIVQDQDMCNGMVHDTIGNYGYFMSDTFPYGSGCWGPGPYPCFVPNCTTNPRSLPYTRPSFIGGGSPDCSLSSIVKAQPLLMLVLTALAIVGNFLL